MTTFELIKKLARKQGLTLAQLNEKSGLGKNSIYHWSTKTPSTDSLSKVAEVLHVSVDYLLGNTDDPNPVPKPGKQSIPDLADEDIVLSFEGRRIPPEDLEIMRRFLRGGQNDK